MKKRLLLFLCIFTLLLSPAAGGEGQRERHSQNGCQHTFCHSFLRNNEAFVSVPAARAPVSRR